MKFRWIQAEKAQFPVKVLCEVLEVSRSGFYAWTGRSPSARQREDDRLAVKVRAAFEKSGRRYGSPRIREELCANGEHIGFGRVCKLMRRENLVARPKKRFVTTTMSQHENPRAANLLNRNFEATKPNEKWVGDITYLPTAQGYIYLAVLMDLHSRRIVGWDVANTMETALAMRALRMALATRTLDGPLLHHTDQGVQYTSADYVAELSTRGITQSMSRTGNCWDNAPAESFFSTLKTELGAELLKGKGDAREVRRTVIDYIATYNLDRRHSSIGYVSPVDFEAAWMSHAA